MRYLCLVYPTIEVRPVYRIPGAEAYQGAHSEEAHP